MESVVEYRRLIQSHTPQTLRRVGASVANLTTGSVYEEPAPVLAEAEPTEQPNINTADNRETLRSTVAMFSGSLALLGANTTSLILEHGVINTANSLLEPAIVAGGGILAKAVQAKRQDLKTAYERVFDLLYVTREEQETRSKFRSLNHKQLKTSHQLAILGEGLGVDGLNFAETFEDRYKQAAAAGKNVKASTEIKSEGKTEKFGAEEVVKVQPSTKFGHFNVILKNQIGKHVEYKAIRNVPYTEMGRSTANLRYSKADLTPLDKRSNPLYTLPLLRTSVFINLIRKGRRVLSSDSTR